MPTARPSTGRDRLAGAVLVAIVAGTVHAQAGDGARRSIDPRALEAVVTRARTFFELPSDLEVDPALRAPFDESARARDEALVARIRDWAAAEQPNVAGEADREAALRTRLLARLANELSLWWIDSAGPAHDLALANALARPGYCRFVAKRSWLAERLLMLRSLDGPARRDAVDGESATLARFGSGRLTSADRPEPSLAQREMRWQAAAAGAAAPASDAAAMPPVLASILLGRKERPNSADGRCALHQWGFATALADRLSPGEALLAWRWETMPVAVDVFPSLAPTSQADGTAPEPTRYPRIAAAFGVQGQVTVSWQRDAQGRATGARVVDRSIVVPGIVGRPLAFETALDDASLTRATAAAPASAASAPGAYRLVVGWKLE